MKNVGVKSARLCTGSKEVDNIPTIWSNKKKLIISINYKILLSLYLWVLVKSGIKIQDGGF